MGRLPYKENCCPKAYFKEQNIIQKEIISEGNFDMQKTPQKPKE